MAEIGVQVKTSRFVPARPSLRARALTRVVRLVVRRWPRGDRAAVVRRSRRVFGLGAPLSFLHTKGLKVEQVQEGAVRGEWLAPEQGPQSKSVLLYLHGGGYVSCSPQSHRAITAGLARLLQGRVFSLDYRLAPESPFPAAVDDAAAAYQWLLNSGTRPENIAVAGDSAGGGLTIALLLRLRRMRLPLPACAVCLSPWVDMTGKYDYRNRRTCAMFTGNEVDEFASLYLQGAPAESEEASPLFADLRGLPPVLIQASSTELLLDDAVRLHERAAKCGVESHLSVYPGLFHVWPIFVGVIPEAELALREIAEFVRARALVTRS
jgi:monoterpene epsilon-lactone hydrolase